jgi:hypothetical protein
MQARHTDLPKQKILHNLQQRSLYRIQQLTTDHTVRRCTCISEADLDISIKGKGRGGGRFIFRNHFFFLLNIKRYRDVIQSENYKTWQKEN